MPVAHRTKPIPSTIGVVFGGLWAFIAAMASPPNWRVAVALLAAAVTVSLVVQLWLVRGSSEDPRTKLFGRTAYRVSVVLEVLALFAASAVLPRLGWQGYLLQVVGIIVGLHFIGLWVATRSSRFLGIAGGMCVVSALAMVLPATFGLFDLRDLVTGAGNALVLWIGASRAEAQVA